MATKPSIHAVQLPPLVLMDTQAVNVSLSDLFQEPILSR